MNIRDVLTFIAERNGKIFSIRFLKRTTGEQRDMACRQGVVSHLVDEPSRPGTDFKKNGLIPVFDMVKQAYRSIPIEGITHIKIDGIWKAVKHES